MRYIYYIIAILVAFSAVVGYELLPARGPEKEAAVRINGRVISVEEFNKLQASCPPYEKEKKDFINSLITKELLIQEAQRQGIDKDESFRRSIQNFYEQSLIKLLIDKKFDSLQVAVGDDEVNNYTRFIGARVGLTIFSADRPEGGPSGLKDGERRTAFFEDLSEDMRNSISSLKEGEMTRPVRIGDKFIVIRLDSVEGSPSAAGRAADREEIKKRIAEAKREKVVNDWIADLRKNASVRVFPGSQDRRQP